MVWCQGFNLNLNSRRDMSLCKPRHFARTSPMFLKIIINIFCPLLLLKRSFYDKRGLLVCILDWIYHCLLYIGHNHAVLQKEVLTNLILVRTTQSSPSIAILSHLELLHALYLRAKNKPRMKKTKRMKSMGGGGVHVAIRKLS